MDVVGGEQVAAPSSSPSRAAAAPWCLRPTSLNDRTLRDAFNNVLNLSASLEPQDRLIMYDACDEGEVSIPLGVGVRKRLDPRRNTKPKKADDQRLVCTPFNAAGFHFGKIRNPGERLLTLPLQGETYHVLTNKFPLFPKHMLLVADALVPQQMTRPHLLALTELLQSTSFCAYFNSWCASASVNHFHCHLIDEHPPITKRPLVPGPLVHGVRCKTPVGFPGFCYVFDASLAGTLVELLIRGMQDDNQPHNLLVTPRHIYVWPKPHARPGRSFELYPETVGGPELLGSFTVYAQPDLDRLDLPSCDELLRINTAPLPSRHLAAPSPHAKRRASAWAADDDAVFSASTGERALAVGNNRSISASLTFDLLPQYALHSESWPQDRPIAKALASNIGLC